MKIVFLSKDYPPNLIGGVGTYVYEISRLLVKMGHSAFVITQAKDSPLEYQDAGVFVFRVKPKRIKILDSFRANIGGVLERFEYSLAVSAKIKELTRRHKIDLIETCEARAEGFWYCLLTRKPPLVIKLHTPETVAFKLDQTPDTLDYRLIKLLEQYWIHRAVRKTGLSREVVDLTERHFRMKLRNVPLIPNPIDIDLFKPCPEEFNDGSPDVLYVGRLEFRKGVHTLIRAFALVQERFPQATLTLIGADCGMKGYLLHKISRLKYPGRVRFIEQIPREGLVEYYQKSSVCIVPSIWENYPYVCLEAMACGKPVIASAIGGLNDMIIHKKSGMLFPPGSSKILGELIMELLRDVKLRQELGINARKAIEENYSPEKIAKKTLEVYQEIIRQDRCVILQ